MFPRILLDDDVWLMTMDWLGIGRLQVSNRQTQRSSVAPPWIKSHMVNTICALERIGWKVHPSNPDLQRLLRSYAAFVLDPNDLVSRTVLTRPAQEVAAAWANALSNIKAKPSGDSSKPTRYPNTYYDWQEAFVSCPGCSWTGSGRDCVSGESFGEGVEKHCPRCNHRFGFVLYPTSEEAASDVRAAPADRALAQLKLGDGAQCVLATADRTVVWVVDADGLYALREHGRWDAAGHELLERINELLPVDDELERQAMLSEARMHSR